jgi:hypothetical protein
MKTLHGRCAGGVHKVEIVVCLWLAGKRKVDVRRFPTTTQGLSELVEWLKGAGCTHDGSAGSRSGTYAKGILR